MKVAPNYPVNICPACSGELDIDYKAQVYRCRECGEEWERTLLNVTKENIEDLETMR